MHARHPQIAKRWDKDYGGKVMKLAASKGKTGRKSRRS